MGDVTQDAGLDSDLWNLDAKSTGQTHCHTWNCCWSILICGPGHHCNWKVLLDLYFCITSNIQGWKLLKASRCLCRLAVFLSCIMLLPRNVPHTWKCDSADKVTFFHGSALRFWCSRARSVVGGGGGGNVSGLAGLRPSMLHLSTGISINVPHMHQWALAVLDPVAGSADWKRCITAAVLWTLWLRLITI